MQWAGIDLAWGDVNTSAAVMLEIIANELVVSDFADNLTDDDSVCSWLAQCDHHDGLYVGIDAPLVVSNAIGERACETMMRRCFGRYEAGPLPANRSLFKNNVRGERIARRLNVLGIPLGGIAAPQQSHVRACFEVFPHASHVGLFSLSKTLKYKAGKGRTVDSRMNAYRELIHHLSQLQLGDFGLAAPSWLHVPYNLRGAGLKRFEDLLDALVCAFTVAYLWQWGIGDRCRILGDAWGEHIVAPVTQEIARCLDERY